MTPLTALKVPQAQPQSRRPTAPLLLLLAATITSTACASMAPRADPLHGAYIASAAADIVSTQGALDRGAKETNVFLGDSPSTGAIVALKTAGWLGLRALEIHVEKRLKRPLQWWERVLLWGAPIGLQTWAAFNNQSTARR